MSEQFPNGIPGKLFVGERNATPGEPYEIAIMATDVRYCPFVALPCGNGETGKNDAWPAMTEANARRLVACWNVCRHLSTEQLEAGDLDYAGCSTLSDIRTALGVGDKPMLGKLATEAARIKRERDEAVKALRLFFDVLEDARDHLQYTGYGDSYERSAARQEKLPERIAEALGIVRAVLSTAPTPNKVRIA